MHLSFLISVGNTVSNFRGTPWQALLMHQSFCIFYLFVVRFYFCGRFSMCNLRQITHKLCNTGERIVFHSVFVYLNNNFLLCDYKISRKILPFLFYGSCTFSLSCSVLNFNFSAYFAEQ